MRERDKRGIRRRVRRIWARSISNLDPCLHRAGNLGHRVAAGSGRRGDLRLSVAAARRDRDADTRGGRCGCGGAGDRNLAGGDEFWPADYQRHAVDR